MQGQLIGFREVVVGHPLLAGSIGARDHDPMHNADEDGPFHRVFELPAGQQFVDHRATAGVLPQTAEQRRSADPLAVEVFELARLELRQDDRTLGVAADRSGQSLALPEASTTSLRPRSLMTRPSSRTLSTRYR